jgi:hydrogenase maturation factor
METCKNPINGVYRMDIGKIPPEMLKRIVLNKLTERRKEVIVRSETGQDSVYRY